MKVLTDDATEFNAWMCVPFPLLEQINNNQKFPNHFEAIVTIEQNIFMVIFDH
jgi:hypothetical protein